MPIYEYQCRKCRKRFEYLQRMSDAPKRKCEACGGQLERQISQTSFQLKGSGWYKDLYSSPKPGKSEGGGSDAAGGESSGSADSGSGAKEGGASADSGSSGDSAAGSGSGSTKKAGSSSGSTKKTDKASKKATKGSR